MYLQNHTLWLLISKTVSSIAPKHFLFRRWFSCLTVAPPLKRSVLHSVTLCLCLLCYLMLPVLGRNRFNPLRIRQEAATKQLRQTMKIFYKNVAKVPLSSAADVAVTLTLPSVDYLLCCCQEEWISLRINVDGEPSKSSSGCSQKKSVSSRAKPNPKPKWLKQAYSCGNANANARWLRRVSLLHYSRVTGSPERHL